MTSAMKMTLNIQHRVSPLHVYCRLVERGLNKKSCLSLCRYYEILIYSWLARCTPVVLRISNLTQARIVMKLVFASLYGVLFVLGVAGIAKAIPIEFTGFWYPIPSESDTMLLLGFGLVWLSGFLRRKSGADFTDNKE